MNTKEKLLVIGGAGLLYYLLEGHFRLKPDATPPLYTELASAPFSTGATSPYEEDLAQPPTVYKITLEAPKQPSGFIDVDKYQKTSNYSPTPQYFKYPSPTVAAREYSMQPLSWTPEQVSSMVFFGSPAGLKKVSKQPKPYALTGTAKTGAKAAGKPFKRETTPSGQTKLWY